MKKFVCVFLALLCMGIAGAVAEGALTIITKNFLEFDADNTAYFYAKIENTGDAPTGVGSGKLVGFSAGDDILVSENYVFTQPNGIVLQPNEYVYAREYVLENALKDNDVADYKFSVETRNYGEEMKRIPCEVMFDLKGADSYDNYIYVTFANDGDSVLYGSYVSVALLDDEENLLFVDGNSYSSLGVHPGSTVTVKCYVGKEFLEHYKAHSLKPTKADAIVFISQDN